MSDDEFTDPLRDPEFPDRPQSAEFWKLSEIVLKHDGASEDEDVETVLRRYIADVEALIYMAYQRSGRMSYRSVVSLAALSAVWIDGFITGAAFKDPS